MILGHSKLKTLIEEHNLISNLDEREINDPEGCVFDLRLEKVFELKGKAFLGLSERETPETVEIASFDPEKLSEFVFEPGK